MQLPATADGALLEIGFKVHAYRRAFFPLFPKFGNSWRYVSIYGGVLSLFVKFSRIKISSSLTFQYLEKKTGKYGRLRNCAKKMSGIWKKKLSDKNDPKTAHSLLLMSARVVGLALLLLCCCRRDFRLIACGVWETCGLRAASVLAVFRCRRILP